MLPSAPSPSKRRNFQLEISHGPFSGECGVDGVSVVIWARAAWVKRKLMSMKPWKCWTPCGNLDDQQRRKFTFIIYDENKREIESKIVQAYEADDYVMKVPFTGLFSGKRYVASVDKRSCSFYTAFGEDMALSFVFSSCLGGQGYGRTKSGWKIFQQMGKLLPNFFIFSGDTIYADMEIPKIAKLFDGSERVNIPHDVICRSVDQFRYRYRYNLEDPFYAKFLRETATYVLWDDHEITDDWGLEKMQENDPELLKNGTQVFFEYWPILGKPESSLIGRRLYRKFESGVAEFFFLDVRGYRSKHQKLADDQPPQITEMLGQDQCMWFIESLKNSTKLWKIIVTSVPLSYPTGWPEPEKTGFDSWCAYAHILDFFKKIRDTKVDNMLFISGDVHFPYFLSYDPFNTGFPMFHEVGATPLSGLALAPSSPLKTLNPKVIWSAGVFAKSPNNFGHIELQKDGTININLMAENGDKLFSTKLKPK